MFPHSESSRIFVCNCCNYSTRRNSQYQRHLLTDKHAFLQNPTTKKFQTEKIFNCICGKSYKHSSTMYAHKKNCIKNTNLNDSCNSDKNTEHVTNDTTNKELIMMLIKQNTQLMEQNTGFMEIFKNGTYNNSNNTTHTNSHNKSFNLQFFLNETCKDAMNIMDFVDSINLQLSDLESVGKLGYVEGISNIIVKNLKEMDIHKRPVHCTDNKRETMYVKDDNKWEKENDDKKKLRQAIRRVAAKNQRLLPKFKEAHPDCGKYHSKFSDQYNKIIVESMGGSGDNDIEKEDKIIKNISKNVSIDKEGYTT